MSAALKFGTDVKKPHRAYGKGKDGAPRASVTTIIKATCGWATPGLMWWSATEAAKRTAELMRQGVDLDEAIERGRKALVAIRERAADAGTRAHEMIEDFLRHGIVPAAPDPWGDDDIDEIEARAARAFWKFYAWWPTSGLEVEAIELPLIDEKLDYAGTIDYLFRRKSTGRRVVADIKSGRVHDEVVVQLGGYATLGEAHAIHIDEGLVVHVPVTDEPLTPIEVPEHQLQQGAHAFGCFFMIFRARKALSLNFVTGGTP